MKKVFVIMALATAMVATAATQQGKSSWDDYKPRTLQSIVNMHQKLAAELRTSDADQFVLSGDSFPSKVSLVYTGKTRALSGPRKKLVDNWMKAQHGAVPRNLRNLFSTEVLFMEGGEERWVAVQEPLMKPLPKEVKPGKPLVGYVIWMGAVKVGDTVEWLFAMNEFDAATR